MLRLCSGSGCLPPSQFTLQTPGKVHDTFGEPYGQTGTSQTAFGFTGEETDGTGLVNLRARYYNPALGVFPSLDPLEGGMSVPMSLNRYMYVQGQVISATDPTGLICFPVPGTKLANCVYDRTRAVEHAEDYVADNYSARAGLNVNGGTDCTNFASQVLVAGGLLLTENWWYTASNGSIKAKSETWAGANYLLDYLTGLRKWSPAPHPDILPIPSYVAVRFSNTSSYKDFHQAEQTGGLTNIQKGDMIFYITRGGSWVDHVAIIVGWGCPFDYRTRKYDCAEYPAPSTQSGYQPDPGPGLVPWIADHGLQGGYVGRIRPYNEFPYDGSLPFYFVRIPPFFLLSNVRTTTLC